MMTVVCAISNVRRCPLYITFIFYIPPITLVATNVMGTKVVSSYCEIYVFVYTTHCLVIP